MKTAARWFASLGFAVSFACGAAPEERDRPELPGGTEATSLLGRPLAAPPLSDEARAARELQLAEARGDLAQADDGERALRTIWVGRRLAYLGRFREALAVFADGHATWPHDARFLRHLGHRQITVREFAAAERALERAAELERGRPDRIEPDGQPNEYGIPLSTTQSNIHYHLGLARYLQGDFEGALDAYDAYRAVSVDDDGEVAIDHWTFMALMRLGRADEARAAVADVHAGMRILENQGYHRLCLMYRGELTAEELLGEAVGSGEDPGVDDATVAYGVGHWHWVHGRRDEALRIWRRVLEGPAWHAFGYIAAEAELARLVLSARSSQAMSCRMGGPGKAP